MIWALVRSLVAEPRHGEDHRELPEPAAAPLQPTLQLAALFVGASTAVDAPTPRLGPALRKLAFAAASERLRLPPERALGHPTLLGHEKGGDRLAVVLETVMDRLDPGSGKSGALSMT